MKCSRALLALCCALLLSSCGEPSSKPNSSEGNTSKDDSSIEVPSSPDEPTSSVELLEFTGLEFNNATYTYDGKAKSLALTGAPEGSSIVYQNNNKTDAGTYEVSVTVSKDGYVTKTLKATLTITPREFDGVSFPDVTEEYDSFSHSIEVVGVLPEGSSVVYTSDVDGVTNSATDVGKYNVTAKITNKNYAPITLNAKLVITAVERNNPMYMDSTGDLYFANALDNGYLYVRDSETKTLTRIAYDHPTSFAASSTGVYYLSSSSFASSIKYVAKGATTASYICSCGAANKICFDGTMLYYSVSSLLGEKGIFSVDFIDKDEPVITKIYDGKAKEMTEVTNNVLYFVNADKQLSYLNVASGSYGTFLKDDKPFKVESLIKYGGSLYYNNIDSILGHYVERAKLDGDRLTFIKLSIDAGKYLSVRGNYLYYSLVDKLTTNIYGTGIYQAPIDGSGATGGDAVISEGPDDQVYGNTLTAGMSANAVSGDYIFYQKVDDYSLHQFSFSAGSDTNLLDGFVPPEEVPLSTGGGTLQHGNDLYYLDIYAGKTLFRYNTVTKMKTKLTSSKVVNFSIYGDNLYFNTVTLGINNNLYVVDTVLGSTPKLLSKDDISDVVSDGTYLYGIKHNAAMAATSLVRMDLDGANPVEFYDKGTSNLAYYKDKIYFIDGEKLYTINTADINASSNKMNGTQVGKDSNIQSFQIYDGKIYYAYCTGMVTNEMRIMNLDANNNTKGATIPNTDKATHPICFTINDGYIYYCSLVGTSISDSGFYKIKVDGTEKAKLYDYSKTEGSVTTYYLCDNLSVVKGRVYFTNYYKVSLIGDSHTYCIDDSTATTKLVKVA